MLSVQYYLQKGFALLPVLLKDIILAALKRLMLFMLSMSRIPEGMNYFLPAQCLLKVPVLLSVKWSIAKCSF